MDMRPRIAGRRDRHDSYLIQGHVPATRRRVENTDYPDFQLFAIPLRHLVFQGQVPDPKAVNEYDGLAYDSIEELLEAFKQLMNQLREPLHSEEVARRVVPFVSTKYYYSYYIPAETAKDTAMQLCSLTKDGQEDSAMITDAQVGTKGFPHFCVEVFDLTAFREYITGSTFGVGRGLAADYDSVTLIVDDVHTAEVTF